MGQATHSDQLTGRQREVLRLIEKGFSNQQIADALGISLAGAKWHVSELIGKLGVDSRDELPEAWASQRRARRWAWFGALTSLGSAKLAAGTAAAAAVIGGGAVAAVAVTAGDSPSVDDDTAFVVATATPFPLPNAPGAVFTAQEALERAEAAIDLGQSTGKLAKPLEPADVTLALAEWLPGITRLLSTDPDQYWESGDGQPRDVWRFHWRGMGIQTASADFGIGVADVEVLVEDGTGAFLASRAIVFDPLRPGEARIGEWSFRSMSSDERIRLMTEPIADPIVVARANGEPDGEALSIYPTAAGNWCARVDSSVTCGFPPVAAQCMQAIPSTTSPAPGSGGTGSTNIRFILSPAVASVRVTSPQGETVQVDALDPPAGSPLYARFAYVVLGTTSGITAIAYDANGNELVRHEQTWAIRQETPPPSLFVEC